MTQERRNYYRILHLQPEAPPEIITAVYRCLMTQMRKHPDLGGDHETAARINQAYAVLSDPVKRRAYDARRRRTPGAPARDASMRASEPRLQPQPPPRACPFCGFAVPRRILAETRCVRCESPLAPIAYNVHATRETFGRRTAPRVDKACRVIVHPEPGAKPAPAALRDLSVTGISLFTAAAVHAGNNIRIEAPGLDVIAHVLKVQLRERTHLVRACLLTALYGGRTGVLVAETA